MAYNEKLAGRIRESLSGTKNVEEKKMFGGVAFMVNDKMCVGVHKDDLIVRCDPALNDELLARKGTRQFDITGKPMKGWLLVKADAIPGKEELQGWIDVAKDSNKKVKSSKK